MRLFFSKVPCLDYLLVRCDRSAVVEGDALGLRSTPPEEARKQGFLDKVRQAIGTVGIGTKRFSERFGLAASCPASCTAATRRLRKALAALKDDHQFGDYAC